MPRSAHIRRIALISLLLGACGAPQPGERWIDQIRVIGNKAFDADQIREGLALRETPWYWWTPFGERQWFDPALFDRDVRRVQGFYAARGYFDAQVVRREVRSTREGRAVVLTLTVDEGQPTKIASTAIRGLERVRAALRAQVAAELPVRKGQRFDAARYTRAKRSLAAQLKRGGHPYADTGGKVEVDRDRRTAAVVLESKPGPLARFGATRFTGAEAIPRDKLRRLLRYRRGERYDPELLERTRERLLALRVFSSASAELPAQPTAEADVTIKLSPAPLRELRLGVGVGIEQQRHEVRLSALWTWRNFLGGLRTLTASVKPAFVAIPALWDRERSGPAGEAQLRLEQPDIFSTAITAYGELGYDVTLRPGYRNHGPRTQLGLERFFLHELLRAGASWNLQFIDFFDIDQQAFAPGSTPLGLSFVDPYRLAFFEEFLQLDLRDQVIDPRAGLFAVVRFEQGLRGIGGEFDYLKLTPEVRGYVPLGTKRLILALRGLFGYLRPASGTSSPVTRRYYLGGPTNHRGFGFQRLSPHSFDDQNKRWVPLGGNTALLLSGDLRLRVVRLWNNWLHVNAFFDAGDVLPEPKDIDLGLLHLATGGSLQYDTPIGSVRFVVGVRLNRLQEAALSGGGMNPDPGERLAFHLTLGDAF